MGRLAICSGKEMQALEFVPRVNLSTIWQILTLHFAEGIKFFQWTKFVPWLRYSLKLFIQKFLNSNFNVRNSTWNFWRFAPSQLYFLKYTMKSWDFCEAFPPFIVWQYKCKWANFAVLKGHLENVLTTLSFIFRNGAF